MVSANFKLEKLTINNETREMVVQYADGILRVAATLVFVPVSQWRSSPELNNMSGNVWEKTKSRVRKAIARLTC